MAELKVRTFADRLQIGPLEITFQRTLRIPDDGNTYPLRPGLGQFSIRKVEDYADPVPEAWRQRGGTNARPCECLSRAPSSWPPRSALAIDALTGKRWSDRLTRRAQNYLVCPDQPWLDGINAGDGFIRQFVAMPLGMGHTVEGQLTGEETEGGIQIKAFKSMLRPRTVDAVLPHRHLDLGTFQALLSEARLEELSFLHEHGRHALQQTSPGLAVNPNQHDRPVEYQQYRCRYEPSLHGEVRTGHRVLHGVRDEEHDDEIEAVI
jgi:hypothetical protein